MRNLLCATVIGLVAIGAVSAQQRFVASLSGQQEVPANNSAGRGSCSIVLNAAETQITLNCTFTGLGSPANAGHIHGNGAVGVSAAVLFGFNTVPAATSGTIGPQVIAVTPTQVANMRAHLHYVNIHSVNLPNGEIRGQIKQINTVFDNDGDGRTDATIFRQSTNTFWVLSSLNGANTPISFGTGSGDTFTNLTSDFDGDGISDPLLIKFDASSRATWLILQSQTNTVRSVMWGDFSLAVNDTRAPADYDGDGKQDIAVFRRSTGVWYVLESSTNSLRAVRWGVETDSPSIGDYDGDGKADPTVVRSVNGHLVWYTLKSSNGQFTATVFGASGLDGNYFFAPIDVDADGKQDICAVRNLSGRQYVILRSSDSSTLFVDWGLTGDSLIMGDYDGDGKTDFVARRSLGGQFTWYILRSSDQQLQLIYWGIDGDQ